MSRLVGTPGSVDVSTLIDQGRQHLRLRGWPDAREAFERATVSDPRVAAAWEGLATAARCLDDLEMCHSALERAHGEYLAVSDKRGAARTAIEIAVYHDTYRGESAVANGWFERARALLADEPFCAEHAWLPLWQAHVNIHGRDNMAAGRRALAEALAANAACHVDEITTLAAGLRGLTLISDGDTETGLRQLDEATTAAVSGGLGRPDVVGLTCCYVLEACETVRDFDRAMQWLEHTWEVNQSLGVPHFGSFCRSHYVAVLTWRGDYPTAEREIAAMRSELESIAPVFIPHCDVRLGEVRRRQGQNDAARRLLEPHTAHSLALPSLAWLSLEEDDIDGAVAFVERYLRRIGDDDRPRRLQAMDLLVRAHAAGRDHERMKAALGELRGLANQVATRLTRGVACEAEAIAAEDPEQARPWLEDAVDSYQLGCAPYETASARLRLAEVLCQLGQQDAALRELEASRSTAERIGAGALLRRAVSTASRINVAHRGRSANGLSTRELEVLSYVAQGLSNAEIAERLFLSAFTVKRHVANILTKLDLPSRAAAASYAIREGLVR